MINAVGWLSTIILLITLACQVMRQWQDRTSLGVSKWFFLGQLAASIGFIVYSALVHNPVFVIANALIALVAIVGELGYYRNRRMVGASKRNVGA